MADVGKVKSKRGVTYYVRRDSDGTVRLDGKNIGIQVKTDAEALAVAKTYVDNK